MLAYLQITGVVMDSQFNYKNKLKESKTQPIKAVECGSVTGVGPTTAAPTTTGATDATTGGVDATVSSTSGAAVIVPSIFAFVGVIASLL